MSLTIALATRARPHLLTAMLNETMQNVTRDDTKVVIAVDADDEATIETLPIVKIHRHEQIIVSVEPRPDTAAAKWNRAPKFAPASVYAVAVDYAPYMTPGFDTMILEAAKQFEDGVGVVYGPLANASFPTLQAPTAGYVEKAGYIYPEYWPYWFVDHWVDDVARMADRIAYVPVVIDCHSRRPSKTTGLRDVSFWATLYDSFGPERLAQAHAIAGPEHRAAVERRYSWVEHRGRWINASVKANAAHIEQVRGEADELDIRYLTFKAKAEKLLLANLATLEAAA